LDLRRRALPAPDIRCYVSALEDWLIAALGNFNVTAERREGRVGLWVRRRTGGEDKIAAIGVRVRHWVTFHGVALNVNPDLSHYAGIVPCGVREHGVTSLHALGIKATMAEVDAALVRAFAATFGATLTPE
jgi:lipoyl(octanoyl) transferase